MRDNENAKSYQSLKHRLFFVGLLIDVVLLLTLIFSGLSVALRDYVVSVSSDPLVYNALYAAILSVIIYMIHFPLNYFKGFHVEHKFKLSTQSLVQWLVDEGKKAVLSLCIFIILIEVIYIYLGRLQSHWWYWTGISWIAFTFVIAKLTPNFIIPIFYKYTRIDNDSLREKILKLFQSSGVALKDAYAINFSAKTKKANAFLCGMGSNRRIVLSDTLLSNFTDDEIEVVVAHELGHYKHYDIFKLLIINGAVIMFGFYLVDLGVRASMAYFNIGRLDDIAFFPMFLLILMAFSLITTPFLNAYSRKIEVEADRFSLEKTSAPNSFQSVMQKLGEMNLSEFSPSPLIEWFFYDHPSLEKRIAFAENYKK